MDPLYIYIMSFSYLRILRKTCCLIVVFYFTGTTQTPVGLVRAELYNELKYLRKICDTQHFSKIL
jgi:phage gp36-like protein